MKKGKAEGLAEGKAIGMEKGKAEGLAEGEAKGLTKVVINTHRAGYPIETISAMTGLTEEEIIKIIKATGESTLG
jgi:flagellar biosynthesis/type III secretory pathway protein FliH